MDGMANRKRWKRLGLMIAVFVLTLGVAMVSTGTQTVQAAKNGWVTSGGKKYYYSNGVMQKNKWKYSGGYWYYLMPNGQMATSYFMTTAVGNTYYLDKSGHRVFGWQSIKDNSGSTNWYYFNPANAKAPGKMTVGFVTISGKRYYLREKASGKGGRGSAIYGGVINGTDGKKYWTSSKNEKGAFMSGFRTSGGKIYFFTATKGLYKNAWFNWQGNRYFTQSNGVLYTGFKTVGSNRYYLTAAKGMYKNAWFTVSGRRYYAEASGALYTGFRTEGSKKYFVSADKGMYKNAWFNWQSNRYRAGADGNLLTGWQTISGAKYYFTASGSNQGVMLKNTTTTIEGVQCRFDANGKCVYEQEVSTGNGNLATPTSERTIKNFLLNALKPVGNTLYVYGGGHGDGDDTRKGLNPQWAKAFQMYGYSYNYDKHRYEHGNGLDCSGFVGWSIYQVMQSKSGGTSYSVWSGDVGSMATGYGFGSIWNQNQLKNSGYKFVAGDIGYDSNHTWIVLGQCADNSLVLVHATPPCVQIAGTPTPNGNYSSQAITLAQTYMKKYYSSAVNGFKLNSFTSNYILQGNYLRWNSTSRGLTDPDGYRNKTANQILANLFSGK